MTTKVAIITRTKNRGLLLKRALLSVSQQSYQDYIHVVVNDGGRKDDVHNAIQTLTPHAAAKVLIIHNDKSLGMEAASNIGIKNSESTYIALLDDDDTWEPEFLEVTINHLNGNQDVMGVATRSNIVFEKVHGESVTLLCIRPYNPFLNCISLYEMAFKNTILNNSFVFRREALKDTGLFDESLQVLGDWDFNLRFLTKFDIDFITTPLSNYHIRQNKKELGNSITLGKRTHILTKNNILNKSIRSELTKNNFGIGYLINTAPYIYKKPFLERLFNLYYFILDKIPFIENIRILFPSKKLKIIAQRINNYESK